MVKKYQLIETINLPTLYETFQLTVFKTNYPDQPNMNYVLMIQTKKIPKNPIIRIHSTCIYSEVFNTQLCDCKDQLDQSMRVIAKRQGILFYLDQEGRGHGLFNKTKELKLQETKKIDTVEASTSLGLNIDDRKYTVVTDILLDKGIKQVRIITNNPTKLAALEINKIKVLERITLDENPNQYNIGYFLTKKNKLGHLFTKLRSK